MERGREWLAGPEGKMNRRRRMAGQELWQPLLGTLVIYLTCSTSLLIEPEVHASCSTSRRASGSSGWMRGKAGGKAHLWNRREDEFEKDLLGTSGRKGGWKRQGVLWSSCLAVV